MNTRILTSVLTITAVVTAVSGMTYAFFSDTGTSSNNTFGSGTFDLHIKDDNEGFTNNVTASFVTPPNWAPGDKYVSFWCVKNNGSIPIKQILLDINSSNASDPGIDLDKNVYVSNIELGAVSESACNTAGTVGSEGLTNFNVDFNSRFASHLAGDNTKATLEELLADIDGLDQAEDDLIDGPATLNADGIMKFRVEWTFDPTATSDVAGESTNWDVVFKGTQDE
jgi:predicted ribosomally synthesized peptide with SipW-like signal peptide